MAAEDDPEAWVTLDSSFHAAIARASHNKVFENVVSDIRDALAHQSETLNMVADRQHASDQEHQRILAAIEAGNAAEASSAMREHLRRRGRGPRLHPQPVAPGTRRTSDTRTETQGRHALPSPARPCPDSG